LKAWRVHGANAEQRQPKCTAPSFFGRVGTGSCHGVTGLSEVAQHMCRRSPRPAELSGKNAGVATN
jgi:hypothetical protein